MSEHLILIPNRARISLKCTFLTGKVGDWQRHLSQGQVAAFEEWEKKHLKDSGLEFSYSLPIQGDEEQSELL